MKMSKCLEKCRLNIAEIYRKVLFPFLIYFETLKIKTNNIILLKKYTF